MSGAITDEDRIEFLEDTVCRAGGQGAQFERASWLVDGWQLMPGSEDSVDFDSVREAIDRAIGQRGWRPNPPDTEPAQSTERSQAGTTGNPVVDRAVMDFPFDGTARVTLAPGKPNNQLDIDATVIELRFGKCADRTGQEPAATRPAEADACAANGEPADTEQARRAAVARMFVPWLNAGANSARADAMENATEQWLREACCKLSQNSGTTRPWEGLIEIDGRYWLLSWTAPPVGQNHRPSAREMECVKR